MSIAASTRSRVSLFTAALSLSTAETVALETPVCLATSVIVGRFPVITYCAGRQDRTDLNLFDSVQVADDRVPLSRCQARSGLLDNPKRRWQSPRHRTGSN